MENNEIITNEMVMDEVTPEVEEQTSGMSNGIAAVLGGAAVLGIIGLVKGAKKLKARHDMKKSVKKQKEAVIDIEEDDMTEVDD